MFYYRWMIRATVLTLFNFSSEKRILLLVLITHWVFSKFIVYSMPSICFKFTSELDTCLFVACQWLPSALQNKSKCLSLAHSKFRMMFPKLVYPSSLQECYAKTTSDTSLTLHNPYLTLAAARSLYCFPPRKSSIHPSNAAYQVSPPL